MKPNQIDLQQEPAPGEHLLKFKGDLLCFTLRLSCAAEGTAWLRTNLGHAAARRREIIRAVDAGEPRLGKDWYDIPMTRQDDCTFTLRLGLSQVGHFQAKGIFLQTGAAAPVWPAGPNTVINTVINVEPADTCGANTLYNAFVRQFGPHKTARSQDPQKEALIEQLDKDGYTVIPPSGTFRDLIADLDFIIGRLGCRYIQLLPVHPTPTTYARMGRYGSPYAALSFTAVDPALARFDPAATPLEQFIELIDAVHARNGKLLIDIAINHTGWAAGLHESHPQWLVREADGTIEVPGAWGVRWEDLTRLDYHQTDLWQYMADVFLIWCRRGVDGFRCDAGYMIPVDAWRYIIARVREEYPDTIFLLEGLGGKLTVTRDLLNRANFNWAYSELFQNYDRRQIESYYPGALEFAATVGGMLNFAETHDNQRLAVRGENWARLRTALCALCSPHGAFAYANGVEWLAADKINVHQACTLNWGGEPNIVDFLNRLAGILKAHPAFYDDTELALIQQGAGNVIVLKRRHRPSRKTLVVAANLDDRHPQTAQWRRDDAGLDAETLTDLVTTAAVTVHHDGPLARLPLTPGQVVCLSADSQDLTAIGEHSAHDPGLPLRVMLQKLRAKALEVHQAIKGLSDQPDFEPNPQAYALQKNPLAYCRALNPDSDETRVVVWRVGRDETRQVMVPPGHFLLVQAAHPFRARLMDGDTCLRQEESLPQTGHDHFALFVPRTITAAHRDVTLTLSLFAPAGTRHVQAPLLYLAPPEQIRLRRLLKRDALTGGQYEFLAVNGRGAMMLSPVHGEILLSRYNALLAANLHPQIPEDRRIMFSRCRVWLVYQGFSQPLDRDCIDAFFIDDEGAGCRRYRVPAGQGEHVLLTMRQRMDDGHNRIRIGFYRHAAAKRTGLLDDNIEVRLILRPDIEDRNFHNTTKAYQGPETEWPGAVTAREDHFVFAPDAGRPLTVGLSGGQFVSEPEWTYMVHRPHEAERGLDPDSDLFSPGYFTATLQGDHYVELIAGVGANGVAATPDKTPKAGTFAFPQQRRGSFTAQLKTALRQFIVQRGAFASVIAGYPWFLDWGRDSLIVARGLIGAGMTTEARKVLHQFGRFEADGTLPNMIHGDNATNRDTSDAPLWFVAACADLAQQEGGAAFLEEPCKNRSVREVILSIGRALTGRPANGIYMDPDTGLLFSPSHFTWMDTNFPAGTPREGFPIEIQALWYNALCFLATIDDDAHRDRWRLLANRVKTSISDYFWLAEEEYLADGLWTASGGPVQTAAADDALRPNQLLAITLGAVDDSDKCRKILDACSELLVPGAIRSLADRPTRHPLVITRNGQPLADPHRPYQGRYQGDEDTRRKPAYHNGTAWTWPMPAYCEAWVRTYGPQAKPTARAWLGAAGRLLDTGCIGQMPEIVDGDYPHLQRGCRAQAWGVSELLRVWTLLA